MAAGIMPPEKGGEFSPCESCEHTDCAALRRRAAATCWHCEKAIGYDVRFYDVGVPGKLSHVHALCEELAIEKETKERHESRGTLADSQDAREFYEKEGDS